MLAKVKILCLYLGGKFCGHWRSVAIFLLINGQIEGTCGTPSKVMVTEGMITLHKLSLSSASCSYPALHTQRLLWKC